MKRTLILSTATALVLGLSGIAWAGTIVVTYCNVNGGENWSDEKLITMLNNRNSNAGVGDGGEHLKILPSSGGTTVTCYDHLAGATYGESGYRDGDPGESYEYNANN